MKRIKAETVAKRFLKTGLTPTTGTMQGELAAGEYVGSCWISGKVNCACGLGVLLPVDRDGIDGCNFDLVVDKLGVTNAYAENFACGFDGESFGSSVLYPETEETVQAYLDGIDAHLETLRALKALTK